MSASAVIATVRARGTGPEARCDQRECLLYRLILIHRLAAMRFRDEPSRIMRVSGLNAWFCSTDLGGKSKKNTAGGRHEERDLQHLVSGPMGRDAVIPLEPQQIY
jgi:hypothetical protein